MLSRVAAIPWSCQFRLGKSEENPSANVHQIELIGCHGEAQTSEQEKRNKFAASNSWAAYKQHQKQASEIRRLCEAQGCQEGKNEAYRHALCNAGTFTLPKSQCGGFDFERWIFSTSFHHLSLCRRRKKLRENAAKRKTAKQLNWA